MRKNQCIVFDLDDTLYPWGTYPLSGFKAIDNYLTQNLSLYGFYEYTSSRFIKNDREKLIDRALEHLNDRRLKSQNDKLLDLYRNHIPNIDLYPDSRYTLSKLKESYHLGLITDGVTPTQPNKVKALGIEHFFEVIIYTDTIQAPKPSPESYRLVMERFPDLDPTQFTYIADDVSKDFLTPNMLGWDSIRIKRQDAIHAQKKAKHKKHKARQQALTLLDALNLIQANEYAPTT